jgi:hypothetical protein
VQEKYRPSINLVVVQFFFYSYPPLNLEKMKYCFLRFCLPEGSFMTFSETFRFAAMSLHVKIFTRRSADLQLCPCSSFLFQFQGGHHKLPDASKWTDEELGIPPDEEGLLKPESS